MSSLGQRAQTWCQGLPTARVPRLAHWASSWEPRKPQGWLSLRQDQLVPARPASPRLAPCGPSSCRRLWGPCWFSPTSLGHSSRPGTRRGRVSWDCASRAQTDAWSPGTMLGPASGSPSGRCPGGCCGRRSRAWLGIRALGPVLGRRAWPLCCLDSLSSSSSFPPSLPVPHTHLCARSPNPAENVPETRAPAPSVLPSLVHCSHLSAFLTSLPPDAPQIPRMTSSFPLYKCNHVRVIVCSLALHRFKISHTLPGGDELDSLGLLWSLRLFLIIVFPIFSLEIIYPLGFSCKRNHAISSPQIQCSAAPR